MTPVLARTDADVQLVGLWLHGRPHPASSPRLTAPAPCTTWRRLYWRSIVVPRRPRNERLICGYYRARPGRCQTLLLRMTDKSLPIIDGSGAFHLTAAIVRAHEQGGIS
jgi:hypothetical protein